MKKRLRGGFTSLELILTLAVVLIISTLASVKALENHKENALEKLYVDTTQLLSQFVATDNLNSYVGFLRAGPSCLDANTYDSAGTRVNFEQFKTCLGDDLGM
ncbi:MAG: hypothetical protein QG567_842, partial [Campylobacterota bacterium]|nr:hypothetical protein [Campylobacterota bacterium]